MKRSDISLKILVWACLLVLAVLGPAYSGDSKDLEGWGMDDPYQKIYNANDVERVKAVVTDIIEVVPLPGMSPGVALMIESNDLDEEIMVHLCPIGYKSIDKIGLRKGDKIDLRGYFAEINNAEVIMAAKIKIKEKVLKLRLTSDGTPFWTLSPAELQKELMDN